MINYIKGDISKTSDRLLLHGCNARGKFASGVAGVIRRVFPYAYDAYHTRHVTHGLVLGNVIYAMQENSPIIANCITQENYGSDGKQYVSYEAIGKCLEKVFLFAYENNITSISMPKIGAGLGGGDWEIIEKIIVTNLDIVNAKFVENSKLTVNIYWI